MERHPHAIIASSTAATMTDALLLSDPRFFGHRSSGYHPERPERLEAARAALERARTANGLSFAPVVPSLEFRTSIPLERRGPAPTWTGVSSAPVPALAPTNPSPIDPSALYEEPERWDGLS